MNYEFWVSKYPPKHSCSFHFFHETDLRFSAFSGQRREKISKFSFRVSRNFRNPGKSEKSSARKNTLTRNTILSFSFVASTSNSNHGFNKNRIKKRIEFYYSKFYAIRIQLCINPFVVSKLTILQTSSSCIYNSPCLIKRNHNN